MASGCWRRSNSKTRDSEKYEKIVKKEETPEVVVDSGLTAPSSDIIIIDCGSGECKAGFAGDNYERLSIPTVVGRPKHEVAVGYTSYNDSYVGFEAQQRRAVLYLNNPIQRGVITNWDDMEIYFDYIFNDGLKIDSSLFNILLTETLTNPSENREKLIELMFERFNVKSFYLAPAPPLALYAYGFHTGVVVDSGEGKTQIVPVYEGFSIPRNSFYIPLGGKDLNRMLKSLLAGSGKAAHIFKTTVGADMEFLKDIKENLCYVALDYQQEFARAAQAPKSYRLPDDSYIQLDNELFLCTEALFDPRLLEVKTGGIHENIYRAIQLSDPFIKHLLYDNIVLSGGNTLFPGLKERLFQEMRLMSEPEAKINVHAKSNRKNAIFFGASLMTSLASFMKMLVKYSEYFEDGPSIVHRRCF